MATQHRAPNRIYVSPHAIGDGSSESPLESLLANVHEALRDFADQARRLADKSVEAERVENLRLRAKIQRLQQEGPGGDGHGRPVA